MIESIIAAVVSALITGVVGVVGVIVALKVQQAVIKNELEHIKTDLKEHNHYAKLFAETMPVVQEQIKVANHRIADLEKKVG